MTETLTEQEWKEESTRLHDLARTHQDEPHIYDALRSAADKAWDHARVLEEKRVLAEANKPETLTRDEYALIENWYDWYLNSPGGKWANQADKDLLHKLARMAR